MMKHKFIVVEMEDGFSSCHVFSEWTSLSEREP